MSQFPVASITSFSALIFKGLFNRCACIAQGWHAFCYCLIPIAKR